MVKSQFSLTWHQFHKSLSTGFSELQQNGEFVDMTLAADGHMVKVHQMLLALASPYFKELIRSAPCPHPVIFLTGISHKTLTYLLEYIYTGQALVPCEDLSTFLNMGKALHIRGLEDVSNVEGMAEVGLPEPPPVAPTPAPPRVKGTSQKYSVGASATQVDLPSAARNVYLKREQEDPVGPPHKKAAMTAMKEPDEDAEYLDEVSHLDDYDEHDDNDKTMTPVKSTSDTSTLAGKIAGPALQYTVSALGAVQLILNRFIYNTYSTSNKGTVKTWRCCYYKKIGVRCPAVVQTTDHLVLKRSGVHNHEYHDKQILSKIQSKLVYSVMDEVVAKHPNVKLTPKNCSADTRVQYTVSYQGNLQMVLNRYVYYMTSKPQSNRPRQHVLWRCADYRKTRCPALVRTQGDVVVGRSHMHNHAFHDKRILRKIRNKEVFSAVEAAQAHFLEAKRNDDSNLTGDEQADKATVD